MLDTTYNMKTMQENTGFIKIRKPRERVYKGPKPKQNEGRTWQRTDKRKVYE